MVLVLLCFYTLVSKWNFDSEALESFQNSKQSSIYRLECGLIPLKELNTINENTCSH